MTSSILSLIADHDAVDVATAIAAYCDVEALGRIACTSAYYASTIRDRSNQVWDFLCESTWAGKVHISSDAVRRRMAGDPRKALSISLRDARRSTLTEEELLGFDWRFRFKEQAGEHWQEIDPFYQTGEAARVRFESVTQDSDPSSYRRLGRVRMSGFPVIDGYDLRWRWAMLPPDTEGSIVQVLVNGMPVPPYVVSRHPSNWGWLMQSCWVVYMSFEMPQRGKDPSLDDSALGVDVETQLEEATAYNLNVWRDDDYILMDDDESDNEYVLLRDESSEED